MQLQRVQNNNYYRTNFGMAAEIPNWQRTAKKVGKNLADALADAQPTIEQLAQNQTVKIIPIKARNLYKRGFKIVVSPTEHKIYGRDFLDRLILKRAPYVTQTVHNSEIKKGLPMKNILVLAVKKLLFDLEKFGYSDINSLV